MLKKILIIQCFSIICILNAQVGIGTTTPHPSSVLDITSNDRGVLVPRVNLIDVSNLTNPITSPATGLLVWNTNSSTVGGNGNGFYFFNGIQWVSIQNSSWLLSGNAGTDDTINFIGTTDNQDVVFKRHGFEMGRLAINNLGFGALNLANITSGTQNNAFGPFALFENTTGSGNSAMGADALQNNTTGDYNTALGQLAIFSNISGSYNTSIGTYSLTGIANGNNNVALGMSAGRNAIAGSSNNIFIGGSAGYLTASTEVSGNIIIGANAGRNNTASNRLFIENSNSNSPLIYGEFDNDILRINGDIEVNDVATVNSKGVIMNDDNYSHGVDNILDFGSGNNDILIASQEYISETGGIHLDGNNVTIWSPGDGNRLVRFLDEDDWIDGNGNPYDNTAEEAYIDANGQYIQASDRKRKENIVNIDNALNKLIKLNGYTYSFKLNAEEVKKGDKATRSAGVIAQELYEVLPEAVQISEDGSYFVNYAAITPLLIESIKALKQDNDQLKSQLKKLELRVKDLEKN